jgi:octaprenyl-diphosphate synthase
MIKTDNLKVLSILADISAKIAEAEVWQLYLIGKIDLKFKDYISLLEAKTANLFAASCECSAIIANATKEQSDALKIFGLNLGVIFQINDDISDYFASNKALGKKRGSDFFENKVTLPLILLLQESTAGDLMQIKSILRMQDKGEAELLKIMEYFGKYSIEKKSYRALETFISDGVKGIEFMPTSQFKNLFIDLIKNYKK